MNHITFETSVNTVGQGFIEFFKTHYHHFQEEEVNELFHELVLRKGHLLRCCECGEVLNDHIGDKGLIRVALDVHPTNPDLEYPIVEVICIKCFKEEAK